MVLNGYRDGYSGQVQWSVVVVSTPVWYVG